MTSDSTWRPEQGNRVIIREREIVRRFRQVVDPMTEAERPAVPPDHSEREWKAKFNLRLNDFLAAPEPPKK